MMKRVQAIAAVLALAPALAVCLSAQTAKQPKVTKAPNEPDWDVVLRERFGLSMYGDLKNPVTSTALEAAGLFRKAGNGPVTFAPLIALGLETRTRGGWYKEPRSADTAPEKASLWSYIFKNTADDLRSGKNLPPPLERGAKTEFDPGDGSFGVWVSNDGLDDGGVFSQPALVARLNRRLAKQPYKAMIYQRRDRSTGRIVPHSYVIGWEYSTNDDFQDVVCQIDNVELVEAPRPE
jgi:hypothetical protein